jgi:ribose transport system permease protein
MAPANRLPVTAEQAGGSDEPAGQGTSRPLSRLVRLHRQPDFWLQWTAPGGLAVLIVVFWAIAPGFLSMANINGVLADASIPIVLATGTTFVIAVAGIDLSLASTVALSSALVGLAAQHGGGTAEICLVGGIAGLLVGLVNGGVIGWIRIPDFIVTLGTLGVAEGLALLVSDGKPVVINNQLFTDLAVRSVWLLRYEVILALAIALILHVILAWTRSGVHLLAAGGNMQAARAVGVKVPRMKLLAYAVSGLGAGVAAVMLTAYVGSTQPSADTNSLLLAIAAVVLGGASLFGGRARIGGTLIGAVLLTTLQDGLTFLGVSAYFQPIVIGIIVVGSAIAMRTQ